MAGMVGQGRFVLKSRVAITPGGGDEMMMVKSRKLEDLRT